MTTVSVSALVFHPEPNDTFKFLVCKSKTGSYQLPAGNLDYGASWSNYAHHQVLSTTGLNIDASQFKFSFIANDKIPVENGHKYSRHCIDIVMSCMYHGDMDNARNLDCDRYQSVQWVDFRYHGLDEDKMYGGLRAVLNSSTFHPVRSNAYSHLVAMDTLCNTPAEPQKHVQITENDAKQKACTKAKKTAAKLECPFVAIDDEVYVIKEDGLNASMNVTSYNGELLPPFISAKGVNWLNEHFRTNKRDILVDTYAKSGTTLTIKLVHQILSVSGNKIAVSDKSCMSDPWRAVPWMEAAVSQELHGSNTQTAEKFSKLVAESDENDTYRVWKSHMSFGNLVANIDANGECKVIHTLRNPKAVFCSYYSFFRKEPLVKYQGDMNTLFDWFCDGTVVHSNYWDHELEWIRAAKQRRNILLISFEEIVKYPERSIQKVAQFLDIALEQKQVEEIAGQISFDAMKKENKSEGAQILMNQGGIARWKTVLSPQQSARLDRITKAKFRHCDVQLIYE